MASSADRKVISYVADVQDVKSKLKELQRLNSKFSKGVGTGMSKEFKQVGKSLGSIKTSEAKKGLNDLANTSTKTSQTFKKLDGSLVSVTKSTRVNAKGVAKTTTAYKDLDQNTVSLGQNIGRLAKRAALTIPLWLALRGTMQAVIGTFKDGAKALLEEDKAFQKAKRNHQGTTTQIDGNFKRLQESALELSLITGESVSDITTAFQRFATTGLDFETSMAGATASTKAAILLFGETEQIANAVARAFRILGGRTNEYTSKGEELEAFLAQIAELWKDNAFEIDEFSAAFERFATQARSSNISLKETATLLSTLQTAGVRGTRAGRLLSTAVLKMDKNFDMFGKTLGVNLKSTNSTFERLRMVTRAIDELNASNPIAASQAISNLFGIRAGTVTKALVVMGKTLDANAEKVSSIKLFNAEFKEQNKQLHRLAKQFTNINTQIKKAFVSGVIGGTEFNNTLMLINDTLRLVQINAKEIGPAMADGLSLAGVFKEFNKVASVLATIRPLIEGLSNGFDKESLDNYIDSLKNIPRSLLSGYSAAEDLSNSILRTLGITDALVTKEEKLAKLKKDEQEASDLIYNAIKASPEQEQDIAQKVLNIKLDQLKAQGALNSQLLKAKSILIDRLGIEEQTIDKISRQLELEQSLSEEKRLQSKLGSDSLVLFKIAKEHGVDTAKQIGEVLSGDVDFSNFVRRGGEVVDIFKDKFASVFEQQQAEAFFKGNTVPGLEDLRGGSGIKIEEQAIRGKTNATDAIIALSKSLSKFTSLEKIQANTMRVTAQNVEIASENKIASNAGLNNVIPNGLPTPKNAITNADFVSSIPTPKNAITNADFTNVPKRPGTLTNADLTSGSSKQETNLNFASGSFILHGGATEKDAELVKKAVKEAIKQVDNKYLGKQAI